MSSLDLDTIARGLASGRVIPFLGPGVLQRAAAEAGVPASPEQLALHLSGRVAVPHKIRTRATATAQFIENFKHRNTLRGLMDAAFAPALRPAAVHRFLAAQRSLPLIVDTWYDRAQQIALAGRSDWGQVQGLSQSEHFGRWFGYYDAAGAAVEPAAAAGWNTLLYKPLGGAAPAGNFLVSDSDFVEVLTEIDIQTPIPPEVQALRSGRSFLFIGCRFDDQLQRSFARQIMKRSSAVHWALLTGASTRNEQRFLAEQHIRRIDLSPDDFAATLGGEHATAA